MGKVIGYVLARRQTALLAALVSATALAAAFTGQFGFDLHPCTLCIYQRWPFAVAIGLGLIGAIMARRQPPVFTLILALLALTFATNTGIAAFHVGVEQGWWQGLSGCSAEVGTAKTIEQLRAQILAAPIVRCDDIAWSLFGISMAGYNVLLCLGLAGYCAIQAWRKGDA
jgi:disulfide bond formation protein DsbB